jgi:alkylated DNA repair dioxygenase AlkB
MISLLESWEMVFRSGGKKEPRILDRRSLVVMTGDARYKWQHEIPARLKELNGFVRGRRISVTFRKVTPR